MNHPATPAGLTGITVNGGDPTSDTDVVIVNGTAAADNIVVDQLSDDGARITGAQPVVVLVDTAEELIVDGNQGGDAFNYVTTGGFINRLDLGVAPDAGRIRGFNPANGFGSLAVSYDDLGTSGSVIFNTDVGNRLDTLEINPSNEANSDDVFDITAAGVVQRFADPALTIARNVPINTPGVANLAVNGLDGSDTFNVPGNHPFNGIAIAGGNPATAGDVVNFAGAGAAVTADLLARSITETGFGPVVISGIESANLSVAGAALTANLTDVDDELTYRPSGPDDGSFQNAGDNTTFNFTGVGDTFLVNEPGGGGNVADHVLVEGTNNRDLIAINAETRVVTVTDVTSTDYQPVTLSDDVEVATGLGRLGNDTFLVTPAPTVAGFTPGSNLLINVDGGQPNASDALVIATATGGTLPATDFVVNSPSLQAGDGRVRVFRNAVAMPDISYTDVEIVSPNVVVTGGVPQLLILGPDASEPNEFRTNATHLGSGDTINFDNLAIFPNFGEHPFVPADVDFFQIVAEQTGTLDVSAFFEIYDPNLLPAGGQLGVNVLDSAGNVIAGAGTFGNPDATADARVRFPAVQGQKYFITVFGANADGSANADVVNGYELTVTNEAPPVPYALELLDNPADGTTNPPGTSANSDTGRSQFDNITYDDTPTLFFRLDDGIFLHDVPGNPVDGSPVDEVIVIPFQPGLAQPNQAGFAIAIFDEGNTPPQTGTAPQTPLGFATAVAGQEGVYTFTVPNALALSEGSHFLSARVQMLDPAVAQQTGFGERSLPLEIIVDRTAPEVFFGLEAEADDGLHPDSDSGDIALPATLVDRITNDTTPTFFGRAEANSIVRAYVDLDNSGTLTAADLLIGQTTATPLDGTEQLETPLNPNEPGGQWELTSTVDMNDPRILTALGLVKDGARRILLSGEDVAGNITAPANNQILELFVDTQGPQVTNVFITDVPAFNLFNLKPDTPQPTPRVDSLTISVQDLPSRVAAFLYPALSNVPPLAPLVLSGDHSGPIAISSVLFNATNNGPGVATGEIVLTFDSPLPDDRYTLTLSDNVIDPAGNRLDGENNAVEPVGTPFFPTGDGIPGGDFVARFTVDSRPEIATWSQGVVYADINGNFVFDPEGQDNDATNRDFVFNFGEITDAYFAGNFSQNATSSGFDKVGAYGLVNGVYQFFLDTDDDGIGDLVPSMAFQINAIPVAGNFFNSAADDAAVAAGQRPRDEIGAYDGEFWYLDVDGNNQIDANEQFATDLRGIPVVGDFNGDGFDDLAVYDNETGEFTFDLDRDGDADDTLTFGFNGFGDRPIAGDFNLDGIDDIGLWVPGQQGQLPLNSGEFHFLVSDVDPFNAPQPNPVIGTGPSILFEPFSPAPLGNDIQSQFGDDNALPLFGNFDPPVSSSGGGATILGSLSNESNRFDTNGDGSVTALDALVVINALARENLDTSGNALRVVASLGGFQLDASDDGSITSLDALQVINELARTSLGSGEAEQLAWSSATDSVIADLDDEKDDDLLALLAADQEQQRVKS
ncbi:MAG: dockerin type I domain-containing protein [Pirellulales bacterium]|nr:dockerin type I domain-containing protein [Pirellulales bacterium]